MDKYKPPSDTHTKDLSGAATLVSQIKPKSEYSYALTEKPCALMTIESMDAFLVGTYELVDRSNAPKYFPNLDDKAVEKKLKAINNRLGSLYLYVNTGTKYLKYDEHNCEMGGVFDIVRSYELDKDVKEMKRFYAAHANGTIACYDVIIDRILCRRPPIRVVEDKTVLLTSIDCLVNKATDEALIVVGDSDGNIYIPIREIVTVQVCQDPIWSVRLLQFRDYETLDNERSIFSVDQYILVGAEDSHWYIYKYDSQKHELLQLYKNDDFSAGITSFCFRTDIRRGPPAYPVNLFVGSYDESIKEYRIAAETGSSQGELVFKVEKLRSHIIPGAGIWKMEYRHCVPREAGLKKDESEALEDPDQEITHDCLNVATMYANPCRLLISAIGDKVDTCKVDSIETTKLFQVTLSETGRTRKEKPLIYGFKESKNPGKFCILDFNNLECRFIETESYCT